MAEYIITTCDGETESVFLAYKEEQRLIEQINAAAPGVLFYGVPK